MNNINKSLGYQTELSKLSDWDGYLMEHSNLPGPRANLELAQMAARMGERSLFMRYIQISPDQAPQNSSVEFLPVCGTIGLGVMLVKGDFSVLPLLRKLASDPRWRIRESVVLALEIWGENDPTLLFNEMDHWMVGNFYEIRAAICALCHPKFLKSEEKAIQVLKYLDLIMRKLQQNPSRSKDDFRVLRLAMGYCWSVAVAALPAPGKKIMESWVGTRDKDLMWIIKSNLNKNRLFRTDDIWVNRMKAMIASTSK
jgi:hypothetical protein